MPLPHRADISWKALVAAALSESGGEAHLTQLNEIIDGHPKTATNPTWRDTIRRVVRQYSVFEPVPPARSGVYRYVGEPQPLPPAEVTIPAEPTEESHGAMQGILASLGTLYGYETYIPANDRKSRSFGGRPLEVFSTLGDIGGVTDDSPARRRLEQIDVLWASEDIDGAPWLRYAFEVEHTTGIRSGLDRLRNLTVRFQTRRFIVAPDRMRMRFDTYMREPAYRQMQTSLFFADYSRVSELYSLATRHEQARSSLGIDRNDQQSHF